jgi:hypothetical protein
MGMVVMYRPVLEFQMTILSWKNTAVNVLHILRHSFTQGIYLERAENGNIQHVLEKMRLFSNKQFDFHKMLYLGCNFSLSAS